jgi:hypothetical protein
MLLSALPPFGTLDYFVESGIAEIGDSFLENLVVPSTIAENGLIHVVPAVGSQSDLNPQNVLGKIARAYVERIRWTLPARSIGR